MNDKDNLTLAELEMLSQAYLDCRLSRLQEKELEYVLMSSGLSSPLIDEVREYMELSTLIASEKPAERRRGVFRVAVAACLGALAIFAATALLVHNEPADNYLCVIVDGDKLPDDKAMEIALETRMKSLEMFNRIVEEADMERNVSIRTMNLLLQEK